MISPDRYRVIGLMSGTSLDGLDVAYCEFEFKKSWSFKLLAGRTFPYSPKWKEKLFNAPILSSQSLLELSAEYGRLMGTRCNQFAKQHSIRQVDFIASHGHTIFHQPENGFTFQLGDGVAIHAATNLPVIFDFRSLDVALGGEGAPLVPVGDKLLFSKYDVCLNLGGIANLSMDINGRRKAFDVSFCNLALNYLMRRIGRPFDKGGVLAAAGNTHPRLLKAIEEVYSMYSQKRPSLSREMFEEFIQPHLDDPAMRLEDGLHTICESVVNQIMSALPHQKTKFKMLATGGGTFNNFLIGLLKEKLTTRGILVVPSRQIIDFKEALVFAFLGVLRLRNEVNVLSSVTKASRNSCSGSVIGI